VQNAISNGHFSGCEIGVFSDSATLFKRAYGTLAPTLGLYAPAVTSSMTYDINYLTQVIGVNSVLMQMYDQAQLNVTDRVSRHFFDFDNNGKRYITIQNVMIHNSGTYFS
jgi:beta-N-acetylhexosaminidase